MSYIINFFNNPFFIVSGGISTAIVILGLLCTVILIIKGILPVLYRIGIGLSKSKIVRFRIVDPANSNNVLSDLLTEGEKKKIITAAQKSIRLTLHQALRKW